MQVPIFTSTIEGPDADGDSDLAVISWISRHFCCRMTQTRIRLELDNFSLVLPLSLAFFYKELCTFFSNWTFFLRSFEAFLMGFSLELQQFCVVQGAAFRFTIFPPWLCHGEDDFFSFFHFFTAIVHLTWTTVHDLFRSISLHLWLKRAETEVENENWNCASRVELWNVVENVEQNINRSTRYSTWKQYSVER